LQRQLRVQGLDSVSGEDEVNETTTERCDSATDTADRHAVVIASTHKQIALAVADEG
jgi:hypothetical protein